jgi:hypothetical protein
MSREVAEIVSQIEQQGGHLSLTDTGRVKCSIPATQDAQATLETLRLHRDELAEYLARRRAEAIEKLNRMVEPEDRIRNAPKECPPLPAGVRLVGYRPKTAPVAIDVCSVVTDVDRFIRSELGELDARLHNPGQIRGGFGVFAILERLRQAGLQLEIVSRHSAL